MARTSHFAVLPTLLVVLLAVPCAASAQRSLAYDTLSGSTPGAVTCGFCGGEKAAVIYYELPVGAGLRPSEFPLLVRELVVAVASGWAASATTCSVGTTPRDGLFNLAVYAGVTVPTAVAALPAEGVWPGEIEVTSAIEVPLPLSISSSASTPNYTVNLLSIPLDPVGLRVEAGYTYLRVVLGLLADAAVDSPICGTGQGPSGLPMRDDAPIGAHRNLIYAGGSSPGWLWNEEVGIAGDWAIRLDVRPLGGPDGGVPEDAGPVEDAGVTPDGGIDADGGPLDAGLAPPAPAADDGCGCVIVGGAHERAPVGAVLSALCVTLALCRPRRRRR
jgi:hypothetical protein